jgi:hypothetical protein
MFATNTSISGADIRSASPPGEFPSSCCDSATDESHGNSGSKALPLLAGDSLVPHVWKPQLMTFMVKIPQNTSGSPDKYAMPLRDEKV